MFTIVLREGGIGGGQLCHKFEIQTLGQKLSPSQTKNLVPNIFFFAKNTDYCQNLDTVKWSTFY